MRTAEECYKFVLKRCGELAAKKRRRKKIAIRVAAPVCGIAVIFSTFGILHHTKANLPSDNLVINNQIGEFQVAENWTAAYHAGTPSSESKTYIYDDIPAFGDGYIVDCTFLCGSESSVDVTAPGNVSFSFTSAGTYKNVIEYKPSYGSSVSFKFSVSNSTNNNSGEADGRILYNM